MIEPGFYEFIPSNVKCASMIARIFDGGRGKARVVRFYTKRGNSVRLKLAALFSGTKGIRMVNIRIGIAQEHGSFVPLITRS